MSIDKQIEYYESLLTEHGENYKALDWNSPESQKLRFEVMEDLFKVANKDKGFSILDVGCGFGDFYAYLKLKKYKCSYTGVDISPKILEVAKKRHPDARFSILDILNDPIRDKFDYVVESGIFNIRTSEETSHLEHVKSMLLRMFELCKIGVGANFLSMAVALRMSSVYGIKEENLNKNQYYYFKPEQIVSFINFISGRYMLMHDYHPAEFTVFILK